MYLGTMEMKDWRLGKRYFRSVAKGSDSRLDIKDKFSNPKTRFITTEWIDIYFLN